MNMNPIWTLGFLLNLFFLYSVFQIYFQSPVVEINQVHAGHGTPPYKRLLFIVCDGLRADTFYMNPTNHPHLSSLLHQENSVWGISETRVPTESRPGHIALFAGIYEDPSAIFTGWKKNFVEFDSVFNRSTHSIALGSPDIVDMFAEGAGRGKVYFESYPHSWQDFLQSDSSRLDTWVLDRFKNLAIKKKLPGHDKLLIFLHLLGVDNSGHARKPNSNEYLANVALVDKIVPEVEDIVNSYYGDDKTLFVFTSDHGMTDWGSHGAGSIAETETPFIIWGTGVKAQNKQLRLKQADFSALVAGALGIFYPTNSIGRFPSHFWEDQEYAFATLLGNFKQIHELMLGKKAIVNRGKVPFVQFQHENIIEEVIASTVTLTQNEPSDYAAAIKKLEEGINVILDGIVYYERYDQWIMTCLTIYSYLAWILLIISTIFRGETSNICLVSKSHVLDLCVSVLVTVFFLEWSPVRIPYTFVPIYLSRLLLSAHGFRRNSISIENLQDLVLGAFFTILVVEILVMTFYHREIISLGLLLNAFWCIKVKPMARSQKVMWIGSTLILAIFPTIPIIGLAKNPFMLTLGSLASTLISILGMRQYSRDPTMPPLESRDRHLLRFQIFQNSSSALLVHSPDFILTRIFAWFSLPSMLLTPVILSSPILSVQFLSIFLAISTPFNYLSLNYEVFFIPALFMTLLILVKTEVSTSGDGWKHFWFRRIGALDVPQEPGFLNSFRLACLNLCFVYVSFFGIGNIASISSFDPSASRCFVSIFNPFVMMGLLLVKIIGPFLLVASAFRLFMTSWNGVQRNFLIVLCLCQAMALHMFLNVTNVGSWLEIGTSISHYVIVQVTSLFLFLLFVIANFLTGIERVPILTRSKLL